MLNLQNHAQLIYVSSQGMGTSSKIGSQPPVQTFDTSIGYIILVF